MISDWFWTARREGAGAPNIRLVCLPHAGGGSVVFQPWAKELPSDIEVWAARLPGREARLREPLVTDAAAIVHELTAAVLAAPPSPHLAIYGHSMGALLGYELAHALKQRGVRTDVLIVSGRPAPQRHEGKPRLHLLADDEFLSQLIELYGGIPQAILEDRELMALFLPILRADLRVVETYQRGTHATADWPLMVYGGNDDSSVSREELLEWQHETTGPFRLQMIPGGHFFHQTHRADFLPAIIGDLRTWCT